MNIYVAMVCDRHTDPHPYVFSSAELAVGFAKATAHKLAKRPEDVVEETVDGWLYCANYSVEGDDVIWVVERTLDDLGPSGPMMGWGSE
jgi:hypothetical protein